MAGERDDAGVLLQLGRVHPRARDGQLHVGRARARQPHAARHAAPRAAAPPPPPSRPAPPAHTAAQLQPLFIQ